MPPKKQIQLQKTVENQEQWNELLALGGVVVIDVYSKWCGPCKAVQGLFRRIKNEIGDDLLKFAMAVSDNIDTLESYRGKSEPTFLFYASGVLVAVVRGALGPELEKCIKEQLSHEHSVLDGNAERKPIEDEGLNAPAVVLEEDIRKEEEPEETRPVPTPKQFTVLVIKPDAVQAGKVDEIFEMVEAQGVEVLAKEERQMTKEEAMEFYKQHEGSDHFEELVEFMSSGPCMTLVLTKGDTGEGVLEEIRELIGPTDVEQAKEEAPESIRATYGTDSKMNAVHASDSHETAARELAFFLPRLKLPYVPGTEPPIERTLALIRPEVLAQHRDTILEKIQEAGFEIAFQKELTLSKEQAEEFYREHEGKDFFESLTTHMSSGPMLALCLAREDAISEWRNVLGPQDVEIAKQESEQSFRAVFAVEGSEVNPLHGSDSLETAAKEVDFFFPVEHTVAVIKPTVISEKESILAKLKESGFQVSLSKETHLTKEMAEQLYGTQKDKEYFEALTNMMSSGPSLFMVLSKPDAILGWRAVIGPTDPDEAKEQNPNCLRALYGKSVLDNALHGSSSKEHALEQINAFFGPVQVEEDGTIKLPEIEGQEEAENSDEAATEAQAEEAPPTES